MARKQAQEQSDHKQTIDMVNSPPHYNKAGIETIDAIMAPPMKVQNIICKAT